MVVGLVAARPAPAVVGLMAQMDLAIGRGLVAQIDRAMGPGLVALLALVLVLGRQLLNPQLTFSL